MITLDNFYIATTGVWKGCKKPKRVPNYTSTDNNGEVSSQYWYGKNKKGTYIIRNSDHWVNRKPIESNNIVKECKSIASCMWYFKGFFKKPREWSCGKIYLSDLKQI